MPNITLHGSGLALLAPAAERGVGRTESPERFEMLTEPVGQLAAIESACGEIEHARRACCQRRKGGPEPTPGTAPVLMPDDKAKYTIAFAADGNVNVRFDCNRGRGTWTSPGPTQLQFGPLALTRAMCPPG